MQGPPSTPKAPLGNNSRPLQGLHYRTVRTNIDFAKVIQHRDYVIRYAPREECIINQGNRHACNKRERSNVRTFARGILPKMEIE